MVNIAMVGYSRFPMGTKGDLVDYLPQMLEGEEGLHYCYVGVLDAPEADFHKIIWETLKSEADVIHFANYRDSYNSKPQDEIFLDYARRRLPETPILLTSASIDAESIASKLGVSFLDVPFTMDDYIEKLHELAKKNPRAA